MENGAGSVDARAAGADLRARLLASGRRPKAKPTAVVLRRGRHAAPDAAHRGATAYDTYDPDPEARPMQTLPGAAARPSPGRSCRPTTGGRSSTARRWRTRPTPLDDDVTIVGPGSVDLWLRSSAADTDIQVTLTRDPSRRHSRPTCRAAGCAPATASSTARQSTRIEPRPDAPRERRRADAAGRVRARCASALFAVGARVPRRLAHPHQPRGAGRRPHALGASTPSITDGTRRERRRARRNYASRLVLPVVPGVDVPPELPPCPGLRGQPCRTYVPASNGG